MGAPGSTRRDGAKLKQKRAVRRLRDSGDRVMLVRGTPGVGETMPLQQGGSALVQALRDTTP
jgi:hypothetical protein